MTCWQRGPGGVARAFGRAANRERANQMAVTAWTA